MSSNAATTASIDDASVTGQTSWRTPPGPVIRVGADRWVAVAMTRARAALGGWIRNTGPVWAPTASIWAARSACLSGRVVSCRRIRPAS